MTRTVFPVLALLVATLLAAPGALADSDGYYCANERYIAYEFRFSKHPYPGHVLTIVFFDDRPGAIDAQEVALGDFQTHGMRCDDEVVRVLAFADRHIVDLSDRQAPFPVTTTALDGNINTDPSVAPGKDRDESRNLGDWSGGCPHGAADPEAPILLVLSPPGGAYRYSLSLQYDRDCRIRSTIVKQAGTTLVDVLEVYSGSEDWSEYR